MPAWRQGVAVGEWRQVSGTALSSAPMAVKTYPSVGFWGINAKVDAWNGFAIDTRDSSIYSVANGGHYDYGGNEVNRIRLTDNAPAWTEPRPATPVAQMIGNVTHYADGRPTSRHSYYGVVLNEQRGRAMVLGGSRWGDAGNALPVVDGFNLATNDWDTARTYPDTPASFHQAFGWALVEKKMTGDIYMVASRSVSRWSNATNSWSKLLDTPLLYGQYAASALDTKRNRILVAGGEVNDRGVYDIATNTVQTITFTGPNAADMSGGNGNGMVYDPGLDAYLLRKAGAGATIYRINAQTFSVDTLPTAGGAPVPAATNGVWRRFLYVPQLKGVVYFPTYGGNFWFIRTS